ncbi:MAG: serine/threonine protein kinase [Planctomycetes bacterium]|nr:serine/threonine protein kinase [Planctomycetota bacterium]
MSKAVAHSFLDLVKRSQLVEADQLDKFLKKFRAQHGGLPERQEALADAMIEAELLTSWQAEKLLAGKHRGFILGKYKFLRQLGKGGMSTVYLAEHMLMKRKVAVKVLPQNRVEDSTYLERFRIEARAAAKLDDPHIVRAFDIDNEGKTHYLVMEYVEGQDLHLLIKDVGRLDYNMAADYIVQVARGLDHAHEMGLVHRDIKPANCLLDKNGVVKLLDMGLARLVGDEASLTMDNNENVLGTADYLAPEQALNSHEADRRADIYSLGCTLYFLLTAHPPFPEGSISERLIKHQVEKPPSILIERPDAPPTLLHICDRMMSKKPDDRYQTAGDVAVRLTEWLADRGQEVGDSKKRSDSGSGIGSDVFRRFAASIGRSGSDSGSSVHRDSSPKLSGSSKSGSRPKVEEQDIGLAPLEEEAEPEEETFDSSDSDTAEGSPAEIGEPLEVEPLKSLVEETIDKKEKEESTKKRFVTQPGEINPLRPPGYSPPGSGPSPWIFVGIGAGVLLVIAILVLTLN